jgi:glycine/D-amino acid oxidase-like deaminating enzyme
MFDALVIGGGLYGCDIAMQLRELGLETVVLAERERGLLQRASYANQARVHNGYHYPRSIPTAERSRANFLNFVEEHAEAVLFDMVKVYAIARDSRVSANQFAAFCRRIGAFHQSAPARIHAMFDDVLVEEVFLAQELSFNAAIMARRMEQRLRRAAVDVRVGTTAIIQGSDEHGVTVDMNGQRVRSRWVINCTYSGLGSIGISIRASIKLELAELAMIRPPRELEGIGVTVMDGPFFSIMPFPALGAHSLSHVRYTPHQEAGLGNEGALSPNRSNAIYMQRDAQRFLPALARCEYLRSIFETKAILARNEGDDGRPILIERSTENPRVISVLGAKIDNIYDVRIFFRNFKWTD